MQTVLIHTWDMQVLCKLHLTVIFPQKPGLRAFLVAIIRGQEYYYSNNQPNTHFQHFQTRCIDNLYSQDI